jgi:hypothetical protein
MEFGEDLRNAIPPEQFASSWHPFWESNGSTIGFEPPNLNDHLKGVFMTSETQNHAQASIKKERERLERGRAEEPDNTQREAMQADIVSLDNTSTSLARVVTDTALIEARRKWRLWDELAAVRLGDTVTGDRKPSSQMSR